MSRILVVEDNRDIAEGLREHLEAEGYEARVALTATAALARAREWTPDLVILDLMLPDLPGEMLLARWRQHGLSQPVLILSARSTEMDKVRGFRMGADDYLTKPFGLLELLARVEALLRRTGQGPARSGVVRFGAVEVRPDARQVQVRGRDVPLRPKELDLLLELMRNADRAIPRQQLLDSVWRYVDGIESRTVDWHVAALRRKLEDDPARPRFLLTVRKVGYRLAMGGSMADGQ